MQKIAKLSLTVLAGLVLSACGSGGDSNNTHSNKSALGNMPSNSATGTVLVMSNKGDDVLEKRVEINDPNTEYLNVDGKLIQVDYKRSDISQNPWLNDGLLQTCCDKYSAVRFGILDSDGPEVDSYMFYNGSATTSMPTSGTATYNGHAIIAGNTVQFDEYDWLKGTSQFNVDFGAKKLKGTLNVDTLEAVNITANIAGNSFAGSANSKSFPTKANVEGKFYGENAKELGGMIRDVSNIGSDDSWGAVFGASQ
ncbi:transferrin-binding protein-like solute binding protein [Actinobacillus equuli subsp. equuli]|uniref:Slam-dependent surface lipoprotein n=1 Tax=Actinobacillus equuli TaxID=718 RepID=UPI0024411AB0|nr:Slam-dependent surface lipoprotein [Actinobacillus equuli]WGE55250.1 transferrin-binding protein-like solute binding protein [Actinobacillus equuli subsp. equuli]WGE65528.1 transferrin-binding protein-like solute binding protein [Actinobacillus equuli subsp. equuli]WGE79526.1 transferrin-binding protein-like solute binding protein [Actinobacillus equuli subsp. equuli]